MYRILCKLVHRWLGRHKIRYALSVISIAISCALVIVVVSLGSSIKTGMLNQLTANPAYRQIVVHGVQSAFMEQDHVIPISDQDLQEITGLLQHEDVRVEYAHKLRLFQVDAREATKELPKIKVVDMRHEMLLSSDLSAYTYWTQRPILDFVGRLLDQRASLSAVVSTSFLQENQLDLDSIGKDLLIGENLQDAQHFTIIGIFDFVGMDSTLMDTKIFLPYYAEPGTLNLASPSIENIVLGMPSIDQVEPAKQQLETLGYTVSSASDNISYIMATGDTVQILGSVAGLVLLAGALFGLANSLMLTAKEYMPFIGVMQTMGMRKKHCSFIIQYEALLQGLWGSALGIAVAAALGGNMIHILSFIDSKMVSMLETYQLSLPVIFYSALMFTCAAGLIGFVPALYMRNMSPIEAITQQ